MLPLHRAITLFAALVFAALPAFAANYPEPQEGSWVARNFKFHSGEVMPEVTLHYRTIGSPSNGRCSCCTAPRARALAC